MITGIGTAIKENGHRDIIDIATKFNAAIGTIHNIVHGQPTSFFADGNRNLFKQWDDCLNAMGDFLK